MNPQLLKSRIRSILKYRKAVSELRKTHHELERRVVDRTLELSKANEELKNEIAERQQTEEALRASEIKFRCVAQSAHDAIISADSHANIIFIKKFGKGSKPFLTEFSSFKFFFLESRCRYFEKRLKHGYSQLSLMKPNLRITYHVGQSACRKGVRKSAGQTDTLFWIEQYSQNSALGRKQR